MVTRFINSFFNGKSFYTSFTFWGIFLYGAVHGGLTQAIQAGYIEVTPLLSMINSLAESGGLLLTTLGIRKATGS